MRVAVRGVLMKPVSLRDENRVFFRPLIFLGGMSSWRGILIGIWRISDKTRVREAKPAIMPDLLRREVR